MSPTDETMPGIKGKRIPGKIGRFAPSQPLHMTTRRAAKTGTTNGTPSLNGSVDEDDSRRGSFDDPRPFTSHSNGSQASAKSRRLSDASVPVINMSNTMNGLHEYYVPEIRVGDDHIYEPSLNPRESLISSTRKRKRSSSPLQPSPSLQPDVNTSISVDNDDILPDYDDEGDTAELVHPDDLSDREVPPSQLSSQSDEAATNDVAMIGPSLDATPLVSGHISPVTSESNSQDEEMTTAKQLGAALEAARAEQDEQDDNDDLADAADDLDDGEEADEQMRTDDDGRPRRGRFGGRRRAKHPDPTIETAMQRQSELKSAYRVIARAQKALLAEIAIRTVDGLQADPEMHLRAAEWDDVRDGLETALEERKFHLDNQRLFGMEQLKTTLKSNKDVKKKFARNKFEDMKDAQLEHLEHEILRIARDAQMNGAGGEYETEDEDDVIPRPKGAAYKFNRTGTLDHEFDSRSRPGLDTQEGYNAYQKRLEMRRMLDELSEDTTSENAGQFTVRDSAAREIAIQRRKAIDMTQRLAQASAEVERLEAVARATRILPNDEAYGLKLLSDLASRPSIGSGLPSASTHKRSGTNSYIGQTPPRPMPPHLQLQTQYGPSRIPVEMSPRTTQAMNDRFDPARPPPKTPRQDSNPIIRSPELTRSESRISSSPKKNGRLLLSSLLSGKPADGRPESRKGAPSDLSRRETSLSGRDLESAFGASPFRAGEQKGHYPSWREYPQEQQSVFERREPANEERPWFEGLGRAPTNTIGQVPAKTDSSPSFGFLHGRPFQRPGFASQASAAEARDRDPLVPKFEASRRATIDSAAASESRQSSIFDGDRQKTNKAFKNSFVNKTTKADRGGATRKEWGLKSEKKFPGKPLSRPGPASAMSPSTTSPTFGSGPADRGLPSMGWQSSAPSMRSPLSQEPSSVFGRPPSFGPPPPPPFHQGMRDHYQPRDSYAPHGGPGSIWNQPPPSPLYAVPPPQSNHPPPPGVPAEQYGRFGPPPPPSFLSGSHPQTPQSAPGSYSQQFGGPPLAPATPNQGFQQPPGFRPMQGLPAFAQQAQQQGGGNGGAGHRRRAQSDASFSKFQPWQPPPSSGRR